MLKSNVLPPEKQEGDHRFTLSPYIEEGKQLYIEMATILLRPSERSRMPSRIEETMRVPVFGSCACARWCLTQARVTVRHGVVCTQHSARGR